MDTKNKAELHLILDETGSKTTEFSGTDKDLVTIVVESMLVSDQLKKAFITSVLCFAAKNDFDIDEFIGIYRDVIARIG